MLIDKWFFLSLAFGVLITQASTPTPDSVVLDRSVALTDYKGTSADAMRLLLAEAQVPGGIISTYSGCTEPIPSFFSLHGKTLRQGLDYVSTLDKSKGWIYRNGVIVVGFELANATLLNTVIRDFDVDSKESLSLATQRLLESTEVRHRIIESGLDELSQPIGFSALRRTAVASTELSPASTLKHLHSKTLQEALNTLASSNGSAVWHYEQNVCGPKSSFRISWSM